MNLKTLARAKYLIAIVASALNIAYSANQLTHEENNKNVVNIIENTTLVLYNDSINTAQEGYEVQRVPPVATEKGATITPGKGSHHKVSLNGKSSVFPDHGAKEIGTGLVEKIKKDLGLK